MTEKDANKPTPTAEVEEGSSKTEPNFIGFIKEAGLAKDVEDILVEFATTNKLDVAGAKYLTVEILLNAGLLLGPALALMEITRRRKARRKKQVKKVFLKHAYPSSTPAATHSNTFQNPKSCLSKEAALYFTEGEVSDERKYFSKIVNLAIKARTPKVISY